MILVRTFSYSVINTSVIQIEDTVISRDLIDCYFHCNLEQCKGACCIEGEAGAPLERDEFDLLRKILPDVWHDLLPEARAVINRQGVGYKDVENDMVTSIVNGKDCVFTCYDEAGICRCAIEKAYNEGRICFQKPVSCRLYPVRVKRLKYYHAANYNRWEICRSAEIAGKEKQVLLYQFLRAPLISKFGEEWYNALDQCAKKYSSKIT